MSKLLSEGKKSFLHGDRRRFEDVVLRATAEEPLALIHLLIGTSAELLVQSPVHVHAERNLSELLQHSLEPNKGLCPYAVHVGVYRRSALALRLLICPGDG